MVRRSLFAIHLFVHAVASAQDPEHGPPATKEIQAVRATGELEVDGVLDEVDWTTAPIASGFVQNEPVPNVPATFDSHVRLLYDDDALYVGAYLPDPAIDSLVRRLTLRDEVEISDWFDVVIDPYRSGINGFEFVVSAANVQADMIVVDDEEDGAWDAVWRSEVGQASDGWVVEIRIPFSAIRFPEVPVQEWNINFIRHVGRLREKSFWSQVDPEREGWLRQSGLCTGVRNVQPPLRLMLYPYASAYLEHYPSPLEGASDWSRSFNGGMDVKYGLSDAYTMDMTLVPDFGQVVSDNVVLNLSPFEVQYNENRQFFTEGMELFERGGLFYSRRIGGEPLLRDEVEDHLAGGETVVDNPETSQLYNATKISGRGRGGLGLGFFNAITAETFATVSDSLGNEREVLTAPLTNYNVLVADQLLPNNGYVSLTNTNVLRDGSHYDADAAALEFDLNNKARSINLSGDARISQQFATDLERDPGYAWSLGAEKTGGNWNYGLDLGETSLLFDPNDLGFEYITNVRGVEQSASFTQYEPENAHWQRWNVELISEYLRVIQPDHFFNFAVELNTFWLTDGFFAMGGKARAEPVVTYDPYEAREPGRLYEFPTNVQFEAWISTDYNKTFALDANVGCRLFNEPGRRSLWGELEPRMRASDRLFFVMSVLLAAGDNNVGWVTTRPPEQEGDGEAIIFGRRDERTVENAIEGRYIFNNRMGLTGRVRHYWSTAAYHDFHLLDEEGRLQPTDYTGLDADGGSLHDIDFDAFNVDLLFSWNFAPGSELTLGWKNSIYTADQILSTDYSDDLSSTLASPQTNSFSLKVLYFIDALSLKADK